MACSGRHLPRGCKLDLSIGLGRPTAVASVTISAVPAEFAQRVWCQSDECPVCGRETAGLPRTKVVLDAQWPGGFACFVGAWAHDGCLGECPVIGPASHVPW